MYKNNCAQVLKAPQFPESRDLVEGIDQLFSQRELPVALGAEYALEAQADLMIKGLRHGFKQFLDDGASIEFFDKHEKEEPQHMEKIRECLLNNDDPALKDHVAEIEQGGRELLDLFATFWRRIHEETRARGGRVR